VITNNMLKLLVLAGIFVLNSAQAALIGGYNIGSYATSLNAASPLAATPELTSVGGSLAGVVTDTSVDTFVNLPGSASNGSINLTLGITGLVNGAGNDLVLFEIGAPDSFSVAINGGSPQAVSTFNTGFLTTSGAQLNAAVIDASNFGITDGAAVSSIDVGLFKGGASFALAGGLTAVPVPAAVWLFGSGLVGLAGIARKCA
jgi:hypothetical protein